MTTSEPSSGQLIEFGSHLINKAQWQAPPEAISWWPNTPIWTCLFFAALISLLAWTVRRAYRWLQRTYVRQTASYFNEYNAANDVTAIAQLMRQFSQQHWPQHALMGLNADQFSQRIVQLTPKSEITEATIYSLLTQSYQLQPTLSQADRLAITQWFAEITC